MNKLQKDPFAQNDAGMIGILKGAIVAVIAIVIIAALVSAIIPGAIDSLSSTNMTASHPTWSDGVVSIYSTLAIFVVIAILLIFVAIIFAVIG